MCAHVPLLPGGLWILLGWWVDVWLLGSLPSNQSVAHAADQLGQECWLPKSPSDLGAFKTPAPHQQVAQVSPCTLCICGSYHVFVSHSSSVCSGPAVSQHHRDRGYVLMRLGF